MRNKRPGRHAVATLALSAALVGCGGFRPLPVDQTELLDRAQTHSEGEFDVTVAVPTVEEARLLFDSKLRKKGIQPVWFEIENRGDRSAWFFPHGIDPNYFPPLEVAWRSHRIWAKKTNRRIDEFFYDQTAPLSVPAGGTISGYVFVNFSKGKKYVPVELLRLGEEHRFEFFVDVPGFRADHTAVDFESLYPPDEIVDLQDEPSLRRWIEELPCCTTNEKETKEGDPLNFALVAPEGTLITGFLRSGWNETAAMTTGTMGKTATAAVFGGGYRYSPISPLYAFDRPQDVGMQKIRRTIHQRNHLRLWLAPVTYRGTPVWIGQISRDIGSRMTTKSSTFTTHKIDPELDDARVVLLMDLVRAHIVKKLGYAKGVGASPPDEPRGNLTGDPYFTDGLRLVLFLSADPTSLVKVESLGWESPAEPIEAHAQTDGL